MAIKPAMLTMLKVAQKCGPTFLEEQESNKQLARKYNLSPLRDELAFLLENSFFNPRKSVTKTDAIVKAMDEEVHRREESPSPKLAKFHCLSIVMLNPNWSILIKRMLLNRKKIIQK